MTLKLYHPLVATRDCTHCEKVIYDEKTGQPQVTNSGRELPRPANTAPCRLPITCPKGSPENPKTLCISNEICYQHYWECKATFDFPLDPIVKRNAAIICKLEEGHKLHLIKLSHYQGLSDG